MDYALLAATALGAIGLYLMLPRERAPLARLGLLVGAMALAGLFLVLIRAGSESLVNDRSMPPVYFYLFAAIMIGGAVGVVSQPKPVYAALYFVLVTLAGSGLFVLLLAEFMAVVLIIIYAGAILVTYVFVIMLASQGSSESTLGEPGGGTGGLAAGYDRRATSGMTAVVLAFLLVGATLDALLPGAPNVLSATWGVPSRHADVTAKLKDLVAQSDGRLDLNVNSSTLGGDFSAAAGATEQPELVVSYVINGVHRNMTVRNGETLAIGKSIARSRAATPDPLMAANMGVLPLVAAPAQPVTSQPGATSMPAPAPLTPSNVQVLGASLYSHYSFSLELAGILLTVALIGAVIIARKNTALEQALGTGKLPAE